MSRISAVNKHSSCMILYLKWLCQPSCWAACHYNLSRYSLETQEVGCHVSISVTFAHGLFHGDLLKSGCSPPHSLLLSWTVKVTRLWTFNFCEMLECTRLSSTLTIHTLVEVHTFNLCWSAHIQPLLKCLNALYFNYTSSYTLYFVPKKFVCCPESVC